MENVINIDVVHYMFTSNIDFTMHRIKLPDVQRCIKQARVLKLINEQRVYYEKHGHYFLDGTIYLNEVEDSLYVVDGQHRLKCFQTMHSNNEEHLPKLSFFVTKVTSFYELKLNFAKVNSREPINTIYFEDMSNQIRDKVDIFYSLLTSNFKAYVKKTNKPRLPHINKAMVESALFHSDIFSKLNHKRSIWDYFTEYNNFLNDDIMHRIMPNYQKCASKGKLMIRLFGEAQIFFERMIDYFKEKEISEELHKSVKIIKHKRKQFSYAEKSRIWEARGCSGSDGVCFCCGKYLCFVDGIIGHIESLARGGTNDIANLAIICNECNMAMGTKNLYQYKAENFV